MPGCIFQSQPTMSICQLIPEDRIAKRPKTKTTALVLEYTYKPMQFIQLYLSLIISISHPAAHKEENEM